MLECEALASRELRPPWVATKGIEPNSMNVQVGRPGTIVEGFFQPFKCSIVITETGINGRKGHRINIASARNVLQFEKHLLSFLSPAGFGISKRENGK